MVVLMAVWMVALLLVAVLSATGVVTADESQMLVTFFTAKMLWPVYLWFLIDWVSRYAAYSRKHERVRRNDQRRAAAR